MAARAATAARSPIERSASSCGTRGPRTSSTIPRSGTSFWRLRRLHRRRRAAALVFKRGPARCRKGLGGGPAPFGGASPGASASFARSGSPIINVNSGFVGGVLAALHVVDEGAQLRHRLMAAGKVEKYARRHARERFQDVHEFAGCHRAGSDRRRYLREPHT